MTHPSVPRLGRQNVAVEPYHGDAIEEPFLSILVRSLKYGRATRRRMLDAWYLHAGLAVVGFGLLGVTTGLPTHPPPDATGVARVVDGVASSPHAAVGEHPLDAARLRLGPYGLTLDGPGGRAHASFRFGPVTPVEPGSDLARVLSGAPPDRIFDAPDAFVGAAAERRRAAVRDPAWRPAPDQLVVRRVEWGEVDVTLVG